MLQGLGDRIRPDGRRLGDDAHFRDVVAGFHVDVLAIMAMGYRGFSKFMAGKSSPEHSLLKLYGSEAMQNCLLAGTGFLGPEGMDVDRARPAHVARRFVGDRSTCAASAARSRAARARSSATSSPNACSACRAPRRPIVSTFDWRPHEPDAERARRYVREGFWNDESLGQILAAGLHDAGDAAFVVRSDRRPFRGTFADVDDLARRVARGLAARGIREGDAVAFQLPNWVEAAATFYATAYLGAIVVPIVHFYGTKEVGYILRRTRVKALVTADRFGAQDFLANLAALRDDGLPDLEWCAVVSDDGATTGVAGDMTFAELAAHDPVEGPVAVDPSAPALIAYTSGTTADPKGVVHVHRTINAEIRCRSVARRVIGKERRRPSRSTIGRDGDWGRCTWAGCPSQGKRRYRAS